MVRETRHLWVGNLPDNIREEKIREHFKRYGRVQSVKILARSKEEVALGSSGLCATVSFMDIKSASKAHNVEQKLDDRCLSTEYHEPAAIPSASPTIPSHLYPAPTRPYIHGSPLEELSSFERSSHFYDREREASYRGRPTAPGYHVVSPIQGSPDPLRNRARDRTVFRAYPQLDSVVATSRGHHHRVGSWGYEANSSRYTHHLSSSPDLTYSEDRRVEPPLIIVRNKQHLKPPSESRGCSEDRSGSPSSSSSAASHSGASSSCSSSSSPSPIPQLPRSPSPGPTLSDKSSSSHSHHGSSKSSTVPSHVSCVQLPNLENQTPLLFEQQQRHFPICIKNLPLRSSDTSLKDGLYHEYKRHGKVTCVKVVGQGCDRYALVFFKKTEDVEKALQVSHDKSFFGSKIEVSAYQGHKDVDDNESRPIETDVDEFHSKATRTLFIGNLNNNTIAADLRKTFETFGEIIEIDIKKGNNINGSTTGTYAFVQYIDISSVVKAMRTMDGEFLAGSRINLGFGKSLATTCVWIDGVAESVSEKYLASHFNQFGSVTHCVIDRSREHALVFFQQIAHAQLAVTQMRGSIMKGRKLQVDFASRECQQGFYEHLDKTSSESSPRFTSQQHDSTAQLSPGSTNGIAIRGFETPSSSCSSAAGDKSYPRNPDEPRSNSISVPNPQDIHNLQKERVSLLEQLEDCNSSGDELLNDSSKAKQVKSRPGTPLLCDERPPESLTPPTQVPRSHVPISLPLPRFAVHVSNPLLSPPLSSPRRPHSSNSDDSQASDPGAPGLEERLRSLDEKYEQWSGSRTSVLKLDTSVRLRSRYKLLDTVDKLEPSDIVKSVLAKPSVFDEDTKRLENFSDKYIPKEFVPSRTSPNLQNFRHQQLGSFSPLTPSSSGSSKSPPASSPAAIKNQYSFPSHPQPITVTQNCRTSPTDPRLLPSDPRLLIDPRLSAADPRLSADSRGSFLTKQNICTINDNINRYVPDILNTKDPRHPIHKDAEIKDGPEAFYRSKIRDEYTKNWLHTFDRKENEPTYRLVDTFDRRRFSDFRKEEEEKLKVEQINKQKLLDGFVVKRKTSSETVVHPSPFFVGVQEKQKNIDDLKKLTENKKVEEIIKREEHVEIKKMTEEIKPPEPPPSVINTEDDKIDFITNENTIANILLSSIENLHKKTELEETRCKVERTNSNECVSKLSDTEKRKEVTNETIKKKEHERKKSVDFDHGKLKEKKDHESKKILGSKSKENENSKSKELEFNMFEINRINNKKKEEILINGKTKDTEKKKEGLKLDKKSETKKEDKKKDSIKEADKKDDNDKIKEKKRDKRDKDLPKHKERKKSLDENIKHKHENSKRSKEHYKCKEEEKILQAVTIDSDGKFIDDKESKKDKRIDRNSISSNSSTGRSSKRRMSDSSENLDDSKRSKIDAKNSKDKSHKKMNDKHISFISKILDGKNKEQKKDHLEKKVDKKKEERKIIKTPNQTETEDEDEDEEARERRKNHSIFEVVLDEPYVSMYDKVKARSTKNMQKQEEEKRQEKLKEKFSQLKQSRAKREEKKRSTSYDGDSDSDRGLQRSSKLLMTSSDDDDDYFRRKNQRAVSDSSENDRPKVQRTISDSYENNKIKTQKVSDSYENERLKVQRAVSDSSENEKFKQLPKFKSRIQSECSDSDDHFVRKSSFTFDRIQNDADIQGFNGHQKKKKQKKQKSDYSRKSIDINGSDSNHRPIKEKKKKHSISHKSNINERMQDIFGSLSDEDNEKTIVNKWSVSDVFGTDSDTDHERKENKPKMEHKKFNEFGKDVLKSLSHNVDEIARKKKKKKKDKERNKEERKEDRKEERKEDRKEERKEDRKEERKEDRKDERKEDRKEERKEDRKEERKEDRKEERKEELREDRKEEQKEIHKIELKNDLIEEQRDVHVEQKEVLSEHTEIIEDKNDELQRGEHRDAQVDHKEQQRDDLKNENKEERAIKLQEDLKEDVKNELQEIKIERLVVNMVNDEQKMSNEVKSDKEINLTLEENKVPKEPKCERLLNMSYEERKVPKESKNERSLNVTHDERKASKEPKHYEEIKLMDNLQSIIESKKKPKEFIANNVNPIAPNRDVFSSFFDFDDSKGPEDETITIFKGDDDTIKTEVMFRKVDEKKELLFRPINSFEPIKREIIGFGSHMDDETAVKSISETPEPLIEAEPVEISSPEEKSTPVISQEETEGAVAALLEASFGQDFCDSSYSDRSAKPDTPVSDSELRIDTDDEDSTDSIVEECKNEITESIESVANSNKFEEYVLEKQDKKEIVGSVDIIESETSTNELNTPEKIQLPEPQQELLVTPEPIDAKPQSPLSHNFRLPQMVIQQTSIRPLNINYAKPLTEVKQPLLSSQEIPEIVIENISKTETKTEDHVSVVKYSIAQIPTVICQEQSVISCAPLSQPKKEFSQPSVLQHTKDSKIVQSCIVSPPIILPEVIKPSLESIKNVVEQQVVGNESKIVEELSSQETATITFAKKSNILEENVQSEEILTTDSKHENVSSATVMEPIETDDKLFPKHPKAKGLEHIVEQINEKIRAKANETALNLSKEPRMMPLKKALIAKEKDENKTSSLVDILEVKSKIVEMESSEDLVVAPLTPKIEDKNEVYASPGESSCEPKELDTARIKKDDEFTKDLSKVIERDTSVRGRRRGGRGRGTRGATSSLVTPRRTRQNIITSNTPQPSTLTDVYEFTDEDEKVSQKYSKSPEPPVSSVMPIITTSPTLPTTPPLVVSTSPLTRKSRRLQEKDGSKTTLEETIDEVARGPCTRRTTRSKPLSVPLLSLETSPRKTKQINGKKLKSESPQPLSKSEITETTSSNEQNDEKHQLSTSLLSTSSSSSTTSETTTLIDPVTGLLIPMQESEEGQYVPIDDGDNNGCKKYISDEPPEKRARLEKTPVTSITTKNSTTIPALAVTPNNILPATTTTYAVTPGMSNVAKTPCVMTIANSAPIGLVKPNITASVIAPTNIVKSTAVMAPSPPPLKTQTTSINKVHHPVISQQSICKPSIPISTMPPPIKSHLMAVSRTPPLPKLLSPKGHIVQAYTSQSMEANNHNSVLNPPSTPQPSQPLLVHTTGIMSPPSRSGLNSPSRGLLSPPSRGLLSPPSRAVPPSPQPTPNIHNSSAIPDIICPKGFDPSKIENSRCIVMRSPSPLVLSGQPMPFEAGVDSTPLNMVPAHHFLHPQLIYPHYLRDSMGAFIPPRNIKVVPGVEENIPPLELRNTNRLSDECITDRLQQHIGRAQQYMNVQQVTHPIGSLPYGQVVPINYGCRPINSILKDFPIYWQGTLALKNDKALVEMHYLFGNAAVAEHSLQRNIDGELKLSQRMRLEQTQLDGVSRKMLIEDECCVLIAVPIGMSEEEWNQQSCTLHNGFITYLQQKQAAGIINITAPGSTQNAYIVHMFPPCDYINSVLATVHPAMVKQIASMAHLIIVIATV